MNYSFFDFLTLVGSLGLFLYGMKIMSEGLQKVAGNKLRSLLATMTKNRFAGVLTGLFITALIQSSSATTVMVVSFVNAGLLTLLQSITVIMGANIGTTVTAWIISLFGFKVSIAAFSIPLIALSIPFIFSAKSKRKSIGEFILGFAFLFMGLEMLKNSVPDLKSNPEMLEFLTKYTQSGFGSVLIFLAIGSILTVVVQCVEKNRRNCSTAQGAVTLARQKFIASQHSGGKTAAEGGGQNCAQQAAPVVRQGRLTPSRGGLNARAPETASLPHRR
jgi:phosphate:Na+ symporter